MNILVPHHWLLDHLKTKADPKQIQQYLSLSGPSVETINKIEGDDVYDIEVTTNRVDAMSIRGIAREAAVILNRYELESELKPLEFKDFSKPETETLPLPKIGNDPKLCQRTMCVVIANVKQKTSPKWLSKRLKQAGFQENGSLIDITNYVTHELGHPCHAFDYDKIMDLGGVINVKTAQAGKPFVTLDGVERETVGGEIVFTNEVGTIIDLPAIIGTANSCVDENTKNVLLWIESLDAQKVRQASLNHAIRTNAAQLNEKGVDPNLAKETLYKGIELYQKVTNGKLASKIYDDYPKTRTVPSLTVKGSLINNYLGIELEPKQVEQILTDLGCKVKLNSANKTNSLAELSLEIQPPSFRPDLQIPADIVEEVARIYGYQELPSILMTGALPLDRPKDVNFALENKIKHFLSHLGWQEIYSISLVSQELAEQSGYKLDEHLQLNNPLLTDNQYLRRNLLPSLQEAILANQQAEGLSVFELAAVYEPQQDQLPNQPLKIGLVSTKNYRQLRGELQALLDQFYLSEMQIVEKPAPANAIVIQQGTITVADEEGTDHELGQIFVLATSYTAAQLDYATLLKLAKKYPNYQPRLKTSPIIEDLTFTVSPQTKVGEMRRAMLELDELITAVNLTDVYQQNHTFEIQYQDAQENLTNEQIQPLRKKLVELVEDQFQAKLVGQV